MRKDTTISNKSNIGPSIKDVRIFLLIRMYRSSRSGLKFLTWGRGLSKQFQHLLWTGPYTEGKAVDNIVLTKSYLDFPTDMMTHMFHST